jgi:hypothetical protein
LLCHHWLLVRAWLIFAVLILTMLIPATAFAAIATTAALRPTLLTPTLATLLGALRMTTTSGILIAAMLVLLVLLVLLLIGLLLCCFRVKFALSVGQQAQVMLRVLLEAFGRNAVIAQLRIAGQLIVFFNNLLWRATHFALWPRRVEDTVKNVASALAIAVAVPFGPRAVLR